MILRIFGGSLVEIEAIRRPVKEVSTPNSFLGDGIMSCAYLAHRVDEYPNIFPSEVPSQIRCPHVREDCRDKRGKSILGDGTGDQALQRSLVGIGNVDKWLFRDAVCIS